MINDFFVKFRREWRHFYALLIIKIDLSGVPNNLFYAKIIEVDL
jgi:hypothetical protein